MASEKVEGGAASNLPYATDPEDFDKMTFEKYDTASDSSSVPVTSPFQEVQVSSKSVNN